MKGKFIVIEGGDGVGKSTQIDLLKKKLGRDDIVYVGDPGGTNIGSEIREIVKYSPDLSERAELFLFLGSRAQLVEEVIIPTIESGKHVISNRFDLSTIAYQVYGRNRLDDLDLILSISEYARVVDPDLYILLDAPVDVSLRRAMERDEKVSRFEEEEMEFHSRVYEGYHKHIEEHTHKIIDATRSIEDVYAELEEVVRETLT